MSEEIKITGLDELQRKLVSMGADVSKKVIRVALVNAGYDVRNQMVIMAPKDSGFLSEHFNVKLRIRKDDIAGTAFVGPAGKMNYPNRGSKDIGVATGKHPKKGGTVPVASVARFLEFGTSKMAARPFMRSAFESRTAMVLNIIINEIKDGIARWTR